LWLKYYRTEDLPMETILKSAQKTVVISQDHPTVIIGERINPTGRKKLAEAFRSGNLEIVREEAQAQIQAGAEVIDINVGAAGVNDIELLPQAVLMAMEAVDAPLSIDTPNPEALREALKVYKGKPLINSVNGEERSLEKVLPLVAEYKTAVIALTMDEAGIPGDPQGRLEVAKKIIKRAESYGIPPEDILIDCLAMTVGADHKAAKVTLDSIRLVKKELGVNLTLGASNVSFGLPEREAVNNAWLPMVIAMGVNAPIVNAAKARQAIIVADLLMGRDEYAMRYIDFYRKFMAPSA
jgi:5-methyltetrahydrofolate--homocysteine methyltransferase